MRVEKKTLNDFANEPTNAVLVRTYGQQDGLPTGECTFGSQPAACRTRDAKLWFPTFKGLASQSAERLREITQARATANPQDWIHQARTSFVPVVFCPPSRHPTARGRASGR